MLRNRSRAVTTKQSIMAEKTPLPSEKQNLSSPISSFLNSPRFFNGFFARNLPEAEHVLSPKSILESCQFSSFVNPFGYDRNLPKTPKFSASENKQSDDKLDPEGLGLAIIDSIKDEKKESPFSKPTTNMVLFGSKHKIQIPSPPSSAFSIDKSLKSPTDFGIKTRNSTTLSPVISAFGSENSEDQSKSFNGKLSLSEMELLEDYTCVITHGPNPKTIHIFDNCIVDGGYGVVGMPKLKKEICCPPKNSTSQSMNFLSFCHTCKNILQEGKDIYMYRGDKAFCSQECRCQEMQSEGKKNSDLD